MISLDTQIDTLTHKSLKEMQTSSPVPSGPSYAIHKFQVHNPPLNPNTAIPSSSSIEFPIMEFQFQQQKHHSFPAMIRFHFLQYSDKEIQEILEIKLTGKLKSIHKPLYFNFIHLRICQVISIDQSRGIQNCSIL